MPIKLRLCKHCGKVLRRRWRVNFYEGSGVWRVESDAEGGGIFFETARDADATAAFLNALDEGKEEDKGPIEQLGGPPVDVTTGILVDDADLPSFPDPREIIDVLERIREELSNLNQNVSLLK